MRGTTQVLSGGTITQGTLSNLMAHLEPQTRSWLTPSGSQGSAFSPWARVRAVEAAMQQVQHEPGPALGPLADKAAADFVTGVLLDIMAAPETLARDLPPVLVHLGIDPSHPHMSSRRRVASPTLFDIARAARLYISTAIPLPHQPLPPPPPPPTLTLAHRRSRRRQQGATARGP